MECTSDVNKNLLPLMVHAYYDRDRKMLQLLNYHNGDIKLIGASVKNRLSESFDPAPVLPSYKGEDIRIISVPIDFAPEKILLSAAGETIETVVYPWKYSTGLTTRQVLENDTTRQLNYVDNKVVFNGNYVFSSDVYIPKGVEEVIFKPGTQIDFINGAGFISFAPVKMNGSADNPGKNMFKRSFCTRI